MFYANAQLQNTFNLSNNLSKHQRFNVNNFDAKQQLEYIN